MFISWLNYWLGFLVFLRCEDGWNLGEEFWWVYFLGFGIEFIIVVKKGNLDFFFFLNVGCDYIERVSIMLCVILLICM